MRYEPLSIYDFQGGLQLDRPPFLLAPDSFEQLQNEYVWRSRLRRRLPSSQLGRLTRDPTGASLGNTGASPWSFNIFTLLGLAASEPDAVILAGSVVIDLATPIQFTDNGDGTLTGDVGGNTGTIDYLTGAVTLTHTAGAGVAATIDFTYFPMLPVMGLYQRFVPALSLEQTIAFDTKYAYRYNTSTDLFEEWIPGTTWTGSDSDFFWCISYFNPAASSTPLFWATNFSGPAGDPMRYTDGVAWTAFLPVISGADELHQCLALVPYKGRLLAFNTYEGANLAASLNFPQRLRFSQVGDPTDQANGWRDDIGGRGGFIDAPTGEHIVSVFFVRDVLIVGFELSTWKVVYTGNEALPFAWQRINSELGAESTFADVGFDQGVLQWGSRAITTTDGNNTIRIDEKIPDQIFNVNNLSGGPERVVGIRDYTNELAYWLFPSKGDEGATAAALTYPNRMLVYNYRTGGFAQFTDNGTFLGYNQNITDETWAGLGDGNGYTLGGYNVTWGYGVQLGGFPDVILGNQQGFVNTLQQGAPEARSLQITAFSQPSGAGTAVQVTSPNHNLGSGQVIRISAVPATPATPLAAGTYQVASPAQNTFFLNIWNGSEYVAYTVLGGETYQGNAFIAEVHNFNVVTKQFSFIDVGQTTRVGYVDFLIENQMGGEIACWVYGDNNSTTPVNEDATGFYNESLSTDNALVDNSSNRVSYHRFYAPVEAQFVQLALTLNDTQWNDDAISELDVTVQNIIVWGMPGGRLV